MSQQSSTALDAHQLYRFFRADDEEVLALRGVSISVGAGEIVAVVGPSGSGKSTLLSCLAGLDEPAAGTVRVGGRRMTGRSESTRASLRAEHIGVLFQGGNLIEHLTIAQNVRLARHLGNKRHDAKTTILEEVGLLPRAAAYPAELSGGESARAGLAVALSNDPEILLADEPTGELDSETEQRVLALFRDRADRGCAVLLVTHSPNVTAVADRVVALSDGLVAS